MRFSVYAIAKNEASHVQRFMDCFPTTQVYILDTGSTDDTVKLFEDRGAVVTTVSMDPFRFDRARQMALNTVSKDTEICLWMDIDEVIEADWKEKAELAFADPEVNCASVNFIFDRVNGNVHTTYARRMLHRRNIGRWLYPVHETFACPGKEVALDITAEHLPDSGKERDYLDLLRLAVKENAEDFRPKQYLGREYMYKKQYKQAIDVLETSLHHHAPEPHVFETLTYLGRCYDALDNFIDAERSFLQAITMCPTFREGFMNLSQFYSNRKMVVEALGMALRSLYITEYPKDALYIQRNAYAEYPLHMAAYCYSQMGIKATAIQYIKAAHAANPSDPLVMRDYANLTGEIPPSLIQGAT